MQVQGCCTTSTCIAYGLLKHAELYWYYQHLRERVRIQPHIHNDNADNASTRYIAATVVGPHSCLLPMLCMHQHRGLTLNRAKCRRISSQSSCASAFEQSSDHPQRSCGKVSNLKTLMASKPPHVIEPSPEHGKSHVPPCASSSAGWESPHKHSACGHVRTHVFS